MGTMTHPASQSVYALITELIDYNGVIPRRKRPLPTAQHIQQCYEAGLMIGNGAGAFVPSQKGWERLEEWSWDERGKQALAFRPIELEDAPTRS